MLKSFFQSVGMYLLGIMIIAFILIAIFYGLEAIFSGINLLNEYTYETILGIIAFVFLCYYIHRWYVNNKINEAIKHGLGDSYMHKLYKIEEKHWSMGSYNIDFPDINNIKDYFYDEYNLYPAIEDENAEPTEIIKVDKNHPLCVSKTHLWAMLSNKNHKGRYYIYRGYKIFEKE